ncbi:MAG: hypothetical protein ACXWK0_17010, partial [Caulobacteraceae bacterium]
MIDRKTWAAAASILALCCAGAAVAPEFNTTEAGLRARDTAAADTVTARVEADRKHPRIGGIWVIGAPVDTIKTVDGKIPAMTAAGQKLYKERVA